MGKIIFATHAYILCRSCAERVEDVDLLIRRAERCLEAGADMIMIDADDVCQHTDSLRADIVAKIVGRLGLEKTMFETSNANTSEWFVKRYGPRVLTFPLPSLRNCKQLARCVL
jgi:phosphosulfolactate synthase (CoM biosynthesis protein A)